MPGKARSPRRIYLSMGTNLGNRRANLERALRLLTAKVKLLKVSPIYETKPIGYANQPDFLNIVYMGATRLSPEQLLAFVKSTERQMGRKRTFKNGPRIIDIDIIFFGRSVVSTPGLTIPHPRAVGREFVLRPLADIAPYVVHPVLHKTASRLLRELGKKQGVRKVGTALKGYNQSIRHS